MNKDFITITPDSGKGGGIISIDAEPLIIGEKETEFTVSTKEDRKTVKVTQQGGLELFPLTFPFVPLNADLVPISNGDHPILQIGDGSYQAYTPIIYSSVGIEGLKLEASNNLGNKYEYEFKQHKAIGYYILITDSRWVNGIKAWAQNTDVTWITFDYIKDDRKLYTIKCNFQRV